MVSDTEDQSDDNEKEEDEVKEEDDERLEVERISDKIENVANTQNASS